MTCSSSPLLALAVVATALFAAAPLAAQSYNFTTLAGSPGIAGNVDGTGSAARFDFPTDLAVDSAGNVFVIDYTGQTIRKITPDGVVTTFAGGGSGIGGDDGQGTAARFQNPGPIAIAPNGDLFVGDSNMTVRKITPSGLVSTFAYVGTADRDYYNSHRPYGIAVDRAGKVIVLGSSAFEYGRLFRFSPEGIVDGAPVGVDATGPMAVGPGGELFATAAFGEIRRIAGDGTISVLAGRPYYTWPMADGAGRSAIFGGINGMAVDSTGRIFVTDSNTIRTVSIEGVVATIAGKPNDYATIDGIGGAARFGFSYGIAVDIAGNLYVADTNGRVIRKGTPTSAISPPILTTEANGQNQSAVVGSTVGFTAIISPATPASCLWSKDGVDLAGATSPTLTLNNVSASDRGTYTLTATNSAGRQSVTAGTLSIYSPPVISFTKRHETAGGSFLWGIAAGNGKIVTVGTGGAILTSSDGSTWTARNSGTTDWLVGVTYGAGKFVAVGNNGRILLSPNGATWTPALSTGTAHRLNNVVYGEGTFVAVGEAGTIVTSTDGQSWTPQNSGVTGWLRGLAYSPTAVDHNEWDSSNQLRDIRATFAACGQDGAVLISDDGVRWWKKNATNGDDLEGVVALDTNAPDEFAGVGARGAISKGQRGRFMEIKYLKFHALASGVDARFRGLATGANALFASGENGIIMSAPAVSGPWTVLPSGTTANLVAGTFFGDSLYIVGENETVIRSGPLYDGRLINISTRGQAGTGSGTMISGFVIQGPGPKQVLLRGIGPTLTNYGLTGVLARPTITLFDTAGRSLASNTAWGTAANALDIQRTAARVGAFALPTGSADSALLLTLDPGLYTAHVTGAASTGSGQANSTTGLALVEAYDADPMANDGPRAINISTRGRVGVGQDHLIAGFVINGDSARRVLIRAAGPALADYGVSGVLAEPQLILHNSDGYVLKTAGAWGAELNAEEIRDAASRAGAFPFVDAGKDSAIVTTLLPGLYTVEVAGRNDTTGVALVEVYDLP